MDAGDAILNQCVLQPGFQKNYKVPVNDRSSRIVKRIKKVIQIVFSLVVSTIVKRSSTYN